MTSTSLQRTDSPERESAAPTGGAERSPLDVALVALVLGFGALGLRPLGDNDVWWHLRTGHYILKNGFTQTDPWSFASTEPWTLHEWGSEVLMYLSYAVGGYRGVIFLHALGVLVLGALLLRSIRQQASPRIALPVGFVALIGVLWGIAERPQLISFCLLAGTLPALRRAVQQRRAPWWFPLVLWAWANLHGLWAVGLVLFGFLVLGLVLEVGLRAWRQYSRFLAVGALALLLVGLTPSGPALWLSPQRARMYADFVSEWRPPEILSLAGGAAYLLLGLLVVAWARSGRRVSAIELSLLVGASLTGLVYTRTLPIFVIAVAPMAAAALSALRGQHVPALRLRGFDRALGVVLVVIFLAGAAAWLPQVPPVKKGAPWGATAKLDALSGRARVLNEYNLGGWMLWAAPNSSPAIDGRIEIYSPDYVRRTLSAMAGRPGWRKYVSRGEFDAAWLYTSSPLRSKLKDVGWKQVFQNDFTVILVPPGRR